MVTTSDGVPGKLPEHAGTGMPLPKKKRGKRKEFTDPKTKGIPS